MNRHIIIFLTFLTLVFNVKEIICQDFGYFEVKPDYASDFDYYSRESGAYSKPPSLISWDSYDLSVIEDGYHREYYFTLNSGFQCLKMEGELKDGEKIGKWTLYNKKSPSFYTGEFYDNNKEGLWLGFFVNSNSDTICIDSIFFENDIINGQRVEYFTNGLIFRTTNYLNGLKCGTQIRYSITDSTNQSFIYELRNFMNDTLNGVAIDYSFQNPSDTVKIAHYSNGKLNGLFSEKRSFNDEKTIIHYSNNQLHGRLKVINPNGTVRFDMEMKNNLPFTLHANNDTSGQPLDSNSFINGTGTLNIYFNNRKIKSSFSFKDQVVNGPYTCYDSKGNISETGILFGAIDSVYKHVDIYNDRDINFYAVWQMRFLKGSKSTFYNEDGSINRIGHSYFDESLKTDIVEYREYQYDSVLTNVEKYAFRLKTGQDIKYNIDGTIKSLENYTITIMNDSVGSFLDGTCVYYNDLGKIRAEVTYNLGEEIGKSYYYDNNSKVIRTKVIEENGSIYNIFNGDTLNHIDSNGLKQGKWISIDYSLNTALKISKFPTEIKYFENSKPCGHWYYYISSKRIKSKKQIIWKEIIWKNDSVGYCKNWSHKGKLVSEGYILNQQKDELWFERDGLWKIYDYKKGRIILEGAYLWGVEVGIWYEYDKKGKVYNEIDYKDNLTKNSW